MKKLVASALAAMMLLTGCGNSENKENTNSTVEVTDTYGTTEVPANPKKVVVFDYGILDAIDAFDIEVELGTVHSSMLPYLEHYLDTTVAVGGVKDPDFEAIYEFEPDLIIIGGRQSDFYEQLSEIAPTIQLGTDYTDYIGSLEHNFTQLGTIFNVQDKVDAAMDEIKAVVEDVKAITATAEEKALILLTNDGNISAYGSGSRFGFVHDALNVKQADEAIESSTHGMSVSYEYIAEKNPDIIFVIDRNAVVAGDGSASSVMDNNLVASTTAAQNDAIYYLDATTWYLATGGYQSALQMMQDVLNVFQ
ncbi:MAG: siderophore ABC transporter substrate-binding protein [Erysipelotrichaceae bacterium]